MKRTTSRLGCFHPRGSSSYSFPARWFAREFASSASKDKSLVVTRRLPKEALDALERGGCSITHYWDEPASPIPRKNLLDWVSDCQGTTKFIINNQLREMIGLYCLLTDKVDVELLSHAPILKVISFEMQKLTD